MTEAHSVIAVDLLATDEGSRDPLQEVSTVLISENPLLQAGLEHLLANTRYKVTNKIAEANPIVARSGIRSLIVIVTKHCSKRAVEAIVNARAQFPGAKICVMADDIDLGSALQAHEAGADGFCLTTAERNVLTVSLDLIMMGEGILPSRILASAVDCTALQTELEDPYPSIASDQAQETIRASGPTGQRLSAREGEILRGLMEGAPNKVIARQFGLSEATVKVHVKAILRKIGAKNRTQAAMWAADHIPVSRTTSLS